MWTIFKVFVEFVTILLLLYALVFQPQGMSGLVCDPPEPRWWMELGASVPSPTTRVQLRKEKPDPAITE